MEEEVPLAVPADEMAKTVRWVQDKESNTCAGCDLLFDWVRRKHHCRYCGLLFCSDCSSQSTLVPGDSILTNPDSHYVSVDVRNPQRVCDECFDTLAEQQEELRQKMSHAVQENSIHPDGLYRFLNLPYSLTLRGEVRKAAYSVHNFLYEGIIKDMSIPLPLISNAKGLAFLTVAKGGFIFSGRVGSGLVISKLEDGSWSAPSAIGLLGGGWGGQIGGQVTDYVIVLNTDTAVEAFCSRGQVSLGCELSIAAGPIGRSVSGGLEASSDMGLAPCYSYSHSKGFFAGVSLEGSVILDRPAANHIFYGKQVRASHLLRGEEPAPLGAQPLYDALNDALTSRANGMNRQRKQDRLEVQATEGAL